MARRIIPPGAPGWDPRGWDAVLWAGKMRGKPATGTAARAARRCRGWIPGGLDADRELGPYPQLCAAAIAPSENTVGCNASGHFDDSFFR
jgi:hypothetical protein